MSSTALLAPGTLIAGRYRIEASLGGEGSAAVYRAEDTRLERAVALRTLPVSEGRNGEAQQGRSAARLVHANVARVIDFGDDAEAGLHYVVADLGTGGTLAALLAQRGAPPFALALRMLQEAGAGMAAAHHAGLVHGDLHPGVIWLSRDEGRLRAQVLGLGLDPSGGLPPRATARYASPERLRRAAVLTPGTDVFSLGAIGFEVLAGLPEDWTTLLLAMARGKAVVAPSPAETRPDLPPHVAQAVRRALVADPDGRWADAGELAAQLFAERAAPPPLAPEPAAPPPVKAPPAAKETKAPPRTPALATTDLADTLYIPPAVEKPAPEPAAPPRRKREKVVAPPAAPTATTPAAAPSPAPALEPAPAPVPALVTVAAPPLPVPVEESTAVQAPVAVAIPARRRAGMARLGKGGGSSRGLIAAGIALVVLVGGGVVARTVLAGPDTPGVDTGKLAAHALAAPPPAAPPAEPEPAGEAAPEAEAGAPPEPAGAAPAVPPPAPPEAERGREAERQRQEEDRRQQQARQDSIRAAQQAERQQPPAAQPPPPAPQQVAAASPRTVEDRQSTQRIDQAVDAPATAAPARAAVDPNRVYGGGEVDQLPVLSNRSTFQSAIQRNYPPVLRSSGTWGSAVVSFVVLPDGRVDRASISVAESSHPAFRTAAASVIAQARFTPGRIGGQAVRTTVSMPVTWRPPNEE